MEAVGTGRRIRSLHHTDRVWGFSIALALVLYILLFSLAPVIMLFVYSFTDYGIAMHTEFLGFLNYAEIFQTPSYLMSYVYTLLIAVIICVLGVVSGFLLAVLMNQLKLGKNFMRVLWYIPSLISLAIMSQFIDTLIASDGVLNRILVALGGEAVIWRESDFWMYVFIISLVVWKGMGTTALYFVAGLNSISAEIYEAAKIDGAGWWTKTVKISVPLVRPIFSLVIITGFINAMSIFEPILILIGDAQISDALNVILYRIYNEAFSNLRFGFSCALSTLFAVIIFALTLLNIRLTDDSIYKYETTRRVKNA